MWESSMDIIMIKKRKISRLMILLFLTMVLMMPLQVLSIKSDQTEEKKAWTALYYIDADTANPWWNIFINMDVLHDQFMYRKQLKSDNDLNILVLQDRLRGPAILSYIDENYQQIVLEDLGEMNMGDPQTVEDFIKYGKEHYPADRYQLCFWGHANAWYGLCPDDSNGGDALNSDECQQALNNAGGVDLLCFIGCCQMGSVEAVYELRDCCDVYVSSESSGNGNDWYGMIDDMCNMLNNQTTISTLDIGEQIVTLVSNNPNEFSDTMTISAVRTDTLVDLIKSFDRLCFFLNESDNKSYRHLLKARNQTKQFPFIRGSVLLDFSDLINQYLIIETNESIRDLLKDIQTNLSKSIIAEDHGSKQNNSNGLSLFYSKKDMLKTYSNYELDFTENTHWDELLIYHKEKTKSKEKSVLSILSHDSIFSSFFHLLRQRIE
jgi:hypothetical protein